LLSDIARRAMLERGLLPDFSAAALYMQWTVDVVPGRGASFSLEAPLNVRFLIRSSLCAASP
jgi:uncharacterized protein (DUF779 family)